MKSKGMIIVALLVLAALALGCTTPKTLTFDVKGQVDRPGTYALDNYKDRLVTINAKLDGKVTHLDAQNYTGVPLRVVLNDSGWKANATQVVISASDGYAQAFDLANVTASDDVILINENDTVRVVAKGYAGGMWVEKVTALEVK